MSITFQVDDVPPLEPTDEEAHDLAARLDMATALEQQLGVPALAMSHEAELIPGGRWDGRHGHPLVVAVHRAFSRHRPLVLSPDVIWLTLAQGFAAHVEQNAEALRGRLVRHEGRAALAVPVMAVPETAEEWREVVHAFGDRLEEHIGPGMRRLMTCDFTTTDAVARTASGVVMMSAFRRYFEYEMVCICGIPRITLEGTVEDWRTIRRRIDVMAEYDLEWWAERLAPVADEWVRTAEGAPDRTFWRCIYKPQGAYGADTITGWLNRLFPYLDGGARNLGMRSASAQSAEEKASWAARLFGRAKEVKLRHAEAQWIDVGISTMDPPAGLSAARVRLMGASADGPQPAGSVLVVGGLVGARITDDGAVRVEPGWAVCEPDRTSRLVEALRARARVEAPPEGERWSTRGGKSAEHVAFDAEIGEAWLNGVHLRSASRAWPVEDVAGGYLGVGCDDVVTGPYSGSCLMAIADLGPDDPRWLGLRSDRAIVLVDPAVDRPQSALPMVARDYGELIERVLASEDGLWFDQPDFVPPAAEGESEQPE